MVRMVKISPSLRTDSRPDHPRQLTCSPNSHCDISGCLQTILGDRGSVSTAQQGNDSQSGYGAQAPWQSWPDWTWGSCPGSGLWSLWPPPQRTPCQASLPPPSEADLPVLPGEWGRPWSPWRILAEYVKGRSLQGKPAHLFDS